MTYKSTLLIGAAIFGLLIWAACSFPKWVFNKVKPGKSFCADKATRAKTKINNK